MSNLGLFRSTRGVIWEKLTPEVLEFARTKTHGVKLRLQSMYLKNMGTRVVPMDNLVRLLIFMFINATQMEPPLVGWDEVDGCNAAAGYSYCNVTDNCIHVTELCE